MKERNVKIMCQDPDDDLDFIMGAHNKEFTNAIGYLSIWGNAKSVRIYVQGDGDISARYFKNADETDFFYEIYAQLDIVGKTYSFHS